MFCVSASENEKARFIDTFWVKEVGIRFRKKWPNRSVWFGAMEVQSQAMNKIHIEFKYNRVTGQREVRFMAPQRHNQTLRFKI